MSKKSILQKILAWLARAAIRRYRPIVVGVAGSVGKTSTKEAIFAVLKKKYRVRRAEKNYNNEIGLPLAILGIPHHGRKVIRWWGAVFKITVRLFARDAHYPEILVLEYGVDRPGDMDYLLSIAKPSIAVVTAIGAIPVHVEFFQDPEALIREKAKLVAALGPEGHAVLNQDDYAVFDMKKVTRVSATTFGFEEHATFRITNSHWYTLRNERGEEIPGGVHCKIEHEGHVVPLRLPQTFGIPPLYAAAAAAGVGLLMKMNLVEISEALGEYVPPPGRSRLLEGIKRSFILDDTYNAAPESMRAALETLKNLPGKRKIAVLGDMLEIGRFTEQAHRALGDSAADFVDLLFTVGPRAKFIADEALTRGFEKHARVLLREQVFIFDDAASAGQALDPLIREGDLILVKGSQAMRMEKAVEEIMAHPGRAGEFLVRQEEYWK